MCSFWSYTVRISENFWWYYWIPRWKLIKYSEENKKSLIMTYTPYTYNDRIVFGIPYSPLSSYSLLDNLFQNLFHPCDVFNCFCCCWSSSSLLILDQLLATCKQFMLFCMRHSWLAECFSNIFVHFSRIITKFHTKLNYSTLI